MLNNETMRQWLDTYVRAWEAKDTPRMLSLYTDDVRYIESPWTTPAVGAQAIREYMEWSFTRQNNIAAKYQIIAIAQDVGVARWNASFDWAGSDVHCDLDGIFEIRFAKSGKCDEFREWWHARETFNGKPVERLGHDEKWSSGKRVWWQRVAADS